MRDEVTTDAASCHQKSVDIGCDQCRIRNVIRLQSARSKLSINRAVAVVLQSMDIDGERGAADRLFVFQSSCQVFGSQDISALNASPFADSDLFCRRNNRNVIPVAADLSEPGDDLVKLFAGSDCCLSDSVRIKRAPSRRRG